MSELRWYPNLPLKWRMGRDTAWKWDHDSQEDEVAYLTRDNHGLIARVRKSPESYRWQVYGKGLGKDTEGEVGTPLEAFQIVEDLIEEAAAPLYPSARGVESFLTL